VGTTCSPIKMQLVIILASDVDCLVKKVSKTNSFDA